MHLGQFMGQVTENLLVIALEVPVKHLLAG